jgi:hypothetical protein
LYFWRFETGTQPAAVQHARVRGLCQHGGNSTFNSSFRPSAEFCLFLAVQMKSRRFTEIARGKDASFYFPVQPKQPVAATATADQRAGN